MLIQGKTAAGLVKHVERALRERWWYVWGTFGNKLTQALLDSKAKQYPTYNGGANYANHLKYLGHMVSDCVGLIKGYCMWDESKDAAVYKANLDVNTNIIYAAASKKGKIADIPEVPGVCVYMPGHVGVYIGNGWVIECTGGRGVVKTPLKGAGATRWTHYFYCPYISYPDDTAKPNPSTGVATASEFKRGDTVKVKQAVTYEGKKFKTYYPCYDVIEVKGDRVVIGKGNVVTAAVKASNLEKC